MHEPAVCRWMRCLCPRYFGSTACTSSEAKVPHLRPRCWPAHQTGTTRSSLRANFGDSFCDLGPRFPCPRPSTVCTDCTFGDAQHSIRITHSRSERVSGPRRDDREAHGPFPRRGPDERGGNRCCARPPAECRARESVQKVQSRCQGA